MSDEHKTQPTQDKRRDNWRAFSDDVTDEAAVAAFEKRYGKKPAQVVRRLGIVLAGPVPEP